MTATGTVAPGRVPLGGVLTPRVERAIRTGAFGSALVIALAAMILSYAGLNELAQHAGVNGHLSLLVPVMVDGLQFVGSLGVVYSTLSGLRSWYPWTLMLLGVAVSAWGNWQAAPDLMTAKMLHASAPVILALVLEELLRVTRHKVQVHALNYLAANTPDNPTATLTASTALVAGTETAAGSGLMRETPLLDALVTEEPVWGQASDGVPSAANTPVVPTPVTTGTRDTAGATTVLRTPAEVPTAIVTAPATVPVATAVVTPVTASENRSESQPETSDIRSTSVEVSSGLSRVVSMEPSSMAAASYDVDVLPEYPADATFREQIRVMLVADPELRPAKISRVTGKDASYTRKVFKEAQADLEASTGNTGVFDGVLGRETASPSQQGLLPRSENTSLSDGDEADPFGERIAAHKAS